MKTMINILPLAYRRQQIVRQRIVQWTTIISIVLFAGWAWHWYEMREQRELSGQLEVLSREHAPTQTMLKQLVDMRHQLKDLQQQEEVANELESQRNALALLGAISDTAQKTKGRLRVTKFELTNFQNVGGVEGASSTAALTLSGVCLDNSAVPELLEGLNHSGLFSKVKLNSLKEREGTDVSLRDYDISCEF